MNKQGTFKKVETNWRYAALRSYLNSFDIINTEHYKLFWRLIGHTAVIYKDFTTGVVYIYESTTQNKFSGLSGVQLTPMRVWLNNYPGKVFVRRVIIDDVFSWGNNTAPSSNNTIEQHIKKYRGTPYPDLSDRRQRNFVINAALDLPGPLKGFGLNPDRDDIMFCTHLVADLWRWRGYYIGDEPPSEFEPDDTRPGGKFENQLVKGLSLDSEIRIK